MAALEGDAAQWTDVTAKKAPSASSLNEWDGHSAARHAEYRGWCPFCAAGKGKSHRRMEASRDTGHPELHQDYAYVSREAEDRASPIMVGKFSKDRWLVTHLVPYKGTQQRLIVDKLANDVIKSGVRNLVMFDQEASTVDMKNTLVGSCVVLKCRLPCRKSQRWVHVLQNTVMEERVGDAEHHENDCCVH